MSSLFKKNSYHGIKKISVLICVQSFIVNGLAMTFGNISDWPGNKVSFLWCLIPLCDCICYSYLRIQASLLVLSHRFVNIFIECVLISWKHGRGGHLKNLIIYILGFNINYITIYFLVL